MLYSAAIVHDAQYGSRTNMRFIVFRSFATRPLLLRLLCKTLSGQPFKGIKNLAMIGFTVMLTTMLASCSQIDNYSQRFYKPKPQKVFQYTYQEPSRSQLPGDFARQLTNNAEGSQATLRLNKKSIKRVRLGRRYFSASGYICRKYSVLQSAEPYKEYASCLIGGRWLDASPITNNLLRARGR